mgnify:CR=1 FL=1
MANPDQKTLLIEKAYENIQKICMNFLKESGTTNFDIKMLL